MTTPAKIRQILKVIGSKRAKKLLEMRFFDGYPELADEVRDYLLDETIQRGNRTARQAALLIQLVIMLTPIGVIMSDRLDDVVVAART